MIRLPGLFKGRQMKKNSFIFAMYLAQIIFHRVMVAAIIENFFTITVRTP